jgi:hypothetical protein
MKIDLIAEAMPAAGPSCASKILARFAQMEAKSTRPKFVDVVGQTFLEKRKDYDASTRSQILSRQENMLLHQVPLPSEDTREKTMQQLMSTLVVSALESMMPQSETLLFGDKVSGNFWRGQQIQYVAEAVSKRLSLGIGKIHGGIYESPAIRAFANPDHSG